MTDTKIVKSNKAVATLMGILFSLLGILTWVVLGYFLNLIAGIAGALMGILFLKGYKKYNPEDKGNYQFVIAVVLTVIEIVVAELIIIALLAGDAGVTLMQAMSLKEIQTAVVADVVIGLLLSGLFLVYYIVDIKRKDKVLKQLAEQELAKQEVVANETTSPAQEIVEETKVEEAKVEVKTEEQTEKKVD